MKTHQEVVEAFNELGYSASFGAVAVKLDDGVDVSSLYRIYPSREALGEAWLADEMPSVPSSSGLHEIFSNFMFDVLRTLESNRDFSRAWLAALKVAGLFHLPQLQQLHDAAATYFHGWLDANQSDLSFPANVRFEDVRLELSDALCGIALALIACWETDRSSGYAHTLKTVNAVSYLLDALLMRRADFGDASLLVHLHFIYSQQHEQFLKPLLDVLVNPERAGRYADPLSLLEVLRTFQPSPAQRT